MGPDLSDGIITRIDETLEKVYIQDKYEDTLFHFDSSKYIGKDKLLKGTKVTYYKLYLEHPTALGLLTMNELNNSDSFKNHSKNDPYLANFKRILKDSKFKILFFSVCFLLGSIIGLFNLF